MECEGKSFLNNKEQRSSPEPERYSQSDGDGDTGEEEREARSDMIID
jgi:hypothetical protein